MAEPATIQSLLGLRKTTRAIADVVRAQLQAYLETLTPLFHPKVVLGDYIQGGQKESTRRADKAFKELQALYQTVAASKPFNLPRELTIPLNVPSAGIEITPVDYVHAVQTRSASRAITVRSPLAWVLTYSGFAPSRLPELLNNRLRQGNDLQHFVLSYLLMHVVTTNQPGLLQVFDALRFPVSTITLPDFASLPVTRIGIGISTTRPPDGVLLESAELTGMDAFEEVVDVEDISRLSDPLKERLLAIVRQAPELV
jgi:hypothetical protein